MKKFKLMPVLAILACGSLLFTSCMGKFSLTNKVYSWNGSLGNKFVEGLVFWAFLVLPVYEFSMFIDLVIFNLIEFWTGSNPLAMNEGDMEQQNIHYKGEDYQITATKNKFHIVQLSGEKAGKVVDLVYNESNKTWNYQSEDVNVAMFQQVEDANGNLSAYNFFTPNGTVSMAAESLYAYGK